MSLTKTYVKPLAPCTGNTDRQRKVARVALLDGLDALSDTAAMPSGLEGRTWRRVGSASVRTQLANLSPCRVYFVRCASRSRIKCLIAITNSVVLAFTRVRTQKAVTRRTKISLSSTLVQNRLAGRKVPSQRCTGSPGEVPMSIWRWRQKLSSQSDLSGRRLTARSQLLTRNLPHKPCCFPCFS